MILEKTACLHVCVMYDRTDLIRIISFYTSGVKPLSNVCGYHSAEPFPDINLTVIIKYSTFLA